MTDLDLDALVFAAVTLVTLFFVAECALGGEPGSEEGGGVEDVLQVANHLGGGDGRRLMDCEDTFNQAALSFGHYCSENEWRKGLQRELHSGEYILVKVEK